jgi:hypothetical protein
VDWHKYVDEDEENEEHKDMGAEWDSQNMKDFNMGDYAGDSDDEEEDEHQAKRIQLSLFII